MRPIRLELSGLNSYIEKQVIDFEKLTERGLFGIFGNTGSGKSTILDAITIAMYGTIARNTKEYINSACDKATISYEFEIGSKNAKRKYKVDRTIVRSKTGTKTSHARLIEIHNDGENKILADKVGEVNDKVAQVVGLTANDFTRSVVLPQGKFNDFLKLTGAERRDMLERIFNLEKYGRGLIDKVRRRKITQLQNRRDINTKLSQYENISEEIYENTLKELELLKEQEKERTKELELAQRSYEESKEVYEEQIKLEKNEQRKKELDLKKFDIKDKTIQLENGLNADKINPYIYGVQSLEKKISADESSIDVLEKKLSILSQELMLSKKKAEEAYKEKNDQMPKLSEEKARLERAKSIETEIIDIDKELKELKEKGSKLNKDKEDLAKIKNASESKKEIVVKNLKDLETKIHKLKISADLKQKIFLAYDYEKEYNKIIEDKKEKNDKLNLVIKEFEDINLKIKYVQKDKDIISKKLDSENIHLESLSKKCPGKNEDILNKTEYLVDLKSKAEKAKDNEERKNHVQNELNSILEQKHNLEREVNSTNEKLETNKKNIVVIEKELDRLKYLNLASELRKELKENMPCPVCGSRHHENMVLDNNEDKIDFTKDKLEHLKREENTIRVRLEELSSKHNQYISAEKIKLKEMEELKLKLGEVKSSELTKKLDEEYKLLEVLKSNLQRWETDKEETESKIAKYKEEKNKIEKEEVKLQESINSYKKNIKELKEEIEEIEEKYKKIKDLYIGLKTTIKIQDIESKVNEINKNEKELEELNTEYEKFYLQKNKLEDDIKLYQTNLHQIELELMKSREVYIEKRRVREDKYSELLAITKGELSQNLLNTLEENIKRIISLEETTKKKLEEQRVEYEKYIAEKNNVEGRLKIAREQFKVQEETLKQLLEDNKFESIYAVKRALLEPDHKKRLGEEISEYEEEQRLLTFKIQELKDKLNGRRVRKEDFEGLKNNIYNLKVDLGRVTKEIGAKQNTIFTLKDSLEKVKVLNKDLKIVEHKVDLLEELDRIIQGNRFVEYVATNQLKYIALEASKRLEEITKGRYALEIDSTLNFVMRDNFNGGLRRSVDTLSGGETFLTSLSLALALSSQIQLKGSAPLEFFFLDEGFGSLDSELLEIVMQSLERLHSDKLSVGIISHVEEMKNRVPIKLVVMPSEAGNGSKVKIEYS